MIDRNEDAILLSGLSDEMLAKKVLDFAGRTIESEGISADGGNAGQVLHHVVPYLAGKFGVEVDADRFDMSNAADHYPGDLEELKVKDMARDIMAVTDNSALPDNALFARPEEGNAVALLLERYMEKIDMPMAVGPMGQEEERSWSAGNIKSGYVGRDAEGTTVIAQHMLEKTAGMGHEAVPYWAPGHTEPPRVYEPGSVAEKFAERLTPETRLMFINEAAYAKRLHALPDGDLAAEMLEQVRDTRERHDIGLEESSGYHRYMTWHGVPMMAQLVGGGEMTADERSHYDRDEENRQRHYKDRREEYVSLTDQQIFDGMSSAVVNGFAEGDRYLIGNKDGIKPTLAERVMFNEPAHGNSMALLLDRVAEKFGVERGGEYDLTGRRLAERTAGERSDHAWKPKEPEAPKPSMGMDQQAMMACQSQGVGI